MNKKVFIGCSSYDTIPESYLEDSILIVKECINHNYDLVFGTRNHGIMGVVYREYLKYPERKIYAICDKLYESDILELSRVDETIITNNIIDQMDYFMTCDKLIYLPGGYGTLTELIYLINTKANHIHNKNIIIMNTNGFYDKIIEHFEKLFEEKFIKDKSLYKVINNKNDLNQVRW